MSICKCICQSKENMSSQIHLVPILLFYLCITEIGTMLVYVCGASGIAKILDIRLKLCMKNSSFCCHPNKVDVSVDSFTIS